MEKYFLCDGRHDLHNIKDSRNLDLYSICIWIGDRQGNLFIKFEGMPLTFFIQELEDNMPYKNIWQYLPHDLLIKISEHLDVDSFSNSRLTCRHWSKCLSDCMNSISLSIDIPLRILALKKFNRLKYLTLKDVKNDLKPLISLPLQSLTIDGIFINNSLDVLDTLKCLKFLAISGYIDRSLTNISKLTHLTHLKLSNLKLFVVPSESNYESEELKGAWYLSNLINLEGLCLNDSFLGVSLINLGNLTKLTYLGLNSASLVGEDFQNLSNLTNLKTLQLGKTDIVGLRQIELLSTFHQLKSLDLSSTTAGVAGLIYVTCLKSLTQLNLSGCAVNDQGLYNLASLTNLEDLNVYDTPAGDYGACSLAELTKLTKLNLSRMPITSLEPISRLKHIKYLYLREMNLRENSICYLSSLQSLITLDLYNTYIGKNVNGVIQILSNLTNLQNLDLSYIHVQDLSFMSKLVLMKNLALRQTWVDNMGAIHLMNLTNLESLDLNHSKIVQYNMHFLTNLKNLTYLDLSGVAVSDLSLFSNFKKINYLNLSQTSITDDAIITILPNFPSLTKLNLQNTALTKNSIIGLKSIINLKSLNIMDCNIDAIDHLVTSLTNLTKLEFGSSL